MNILFNTLNEEVIDFAPNDTLSQISFDKYGDFKAWRDIADANDAFDLFQEYSSDIPINIPSVDFVRDKVANISSSIDSIIDQVQQDSIGKIGRLPHQVIDWIL